MPRSRPPSKGHRLSVTRDTFWVYRPAAGLLERLDGRGEVVAEVEGLRDLLALGPCRDGGVLAVAPRTGKVLRFSGAGVLVGDYPDPGSLAAVADPLGHPYGLAVSPRALELQRSQPGQVPQTLARIDLDASIPANARVTLATILGADRVGNIYLLVEAADDEPVIHAHRLLKVAATGRVLASREAEPLGFSPECPPCYAIGPEGDIYSYRCAGGSWSLIGWRLP